MKLLTILALTLFTYVAVAQDTTWVKGKIVDAEQLEPVVNAHVKIGEKEVLSDHLGIFSIQILANELIASSLDIAAAGFSKFHLSSISDSAFLFIKLLPLTRSYSENVSVAFGGKDIIRRAYENIPINYSIQPFNHAILQFSQEHIDDTAYTLSDVAKVKYYISGYGENKNNYQIQLIQNRQKIKEFSDEIKENKEVLSWQLIGPFEVFPRYDVVFSRYSFLDTSHWENYSYKLLSKIKWKQRTVYPIRFHTIDSTKFGYEGVVLIDSATYGIYHVNMHVNWAARIATARKNKGSDFFSQSEIQYIYDGKKWQYASSHTEGYQVRMFHKKPHQFDFILDAITYPETFQSIDKIPILKRVSHYSKLSSFNKPGSNESWKSILDFIQTKSFQSQYPWLSDLGW